MMTKEQAESYFEQGGCYNGLLRTATLLAIEHKQNCSGENCGVQLFALKVLLDCAKVEIPNQFVECFI